LGEKGKRRLKEVHESLNGSMENMRELEEVRGI
jgi:hypothetical protein